MRLARSLTAVPRVALAVVWLAAPSAALAEQSQVEVGRRAHRFAQELMSPFCPGRTLADCPSPDAAALKQEARVLLAEGLSEQQIRERFEARFGDVFSATPRSLVGWLLPLVALLAGALLLGVGLRRVSTRARTAAKTEGPPIPDDLRASLDRELQKRGL